MPRTARKAPGGVVFHALNRGVGRRTLFHKDEDFAAFERILEQALSIVPVRLLSYCLMPNHWHLLLWPRAEGDLGRFMQRLTTAHVRRWQAHYQEVGLGHLYQGRFKSFPVQEDAHFLTVARYVERNPLRANLVPQAQAWRWSSLRRREHGSAQERGLLSEWPLARPADWLPWVNEPQTDAELLALRNSITKGTPLGERPSPRPARQRPPPRPAEDPPRGGRGSETVTVPFSESVFGVPFSESRFRSPVFGVLSRFRSLMGIQ